MAQASAIKPTHRAIEKYYQALRRLSGEHVTHELGLRSAFQNLLEDTAKLHGWSFIAELTAPRSTGVSPVPPPRHERDARGTIRPDGTIREGNSLPRGYRLGNRSALDWIIDQYQVSEDKRSAIKSDPNRPDDPEYIVRLIGQVVRVSVETVKLVNSLPQSYD